MKKLTLNMEEALYARFEDALIAEYGFSDGLVNKVIRKIILEYCVSVVPEAEWNYRSKISKARVS